jgi:hypothetical protein
MHISFDDCSTPDALQKTLQRIISAINGLVAETVKDVISSAKEIASDNINDAILGSREGDAVEGAVEETQQNKKGKKK